MSDLADTGVRQKRETQRERVAAAIFDAVWSHTGREWPRWLDSDNSRAKDEALIAADAAIAAHPDPYVKKERDRPKTPDDPCRLYAKRSEFAALVKFIEERGYDPAPEALTAASLARALREQGVV